MESDVILSAVASQITGVSIVYSTVCSGVDKRSSSLAFVRGIHRWPVNSLHNGIWWRHRVLLTDWKYAVLSGPGNADSISDIRVIILQYAQRGHRRYPAACPLVQIMGYILCVPYFANLSPSSLLCCMCYIFILHRVVSRLVDGYFLLIIPNLIFGNLLRISAYVEWCIYDSVRLDCH